MGSTTNLYEDLSDLSSEDSFLLYKNKQQIPNIPVPVFKKPNRKLFDRKPADVPRIRKSEVLKCIDTTKATIANSTPLHPINKRRNANSLLRLSPIHSPIYYTNVEEQELSKTLTNKSAVADQAENGDHLADILSANLEISTNKPNLAVETNPIILCERQTQTTDSLNNPQPILDVQRAEPNKEANKSLQQSFSNNAVIDKFLENFDATVAPQFTSIITISSESSFSNTPSKQENVRDTLNSTKRKLVDHDITNKENLIEPELNLKISKTNAATDFINNDAMNDQNQSHINSIVDEQSTAKMPKQKRNKESKNNSIKELINVKVTDKTSVVVGKRVSRKKSGTATVTVTRKRSSKRKTINLQQYVVCSKSNYIEVSQNESSDLDENTSEVRRSRRTRNPPKAYIHATYIGPLKNRISKELRPSSINSTNQNRRTTKRLTNLQVLPKVSESTTNEKYVKDQVQSNTSTNEILAKIENKSENQAQPKLPSSNPIENIQIRETPKSAISEEHLFKKPILRSHKKSNKKKSQFAKISTENENVTSETPEIPFQTQESENTNHVQNNEPSLLNIAISENLETNKMFTEVVQQSTSNACETNTCVVIHHRSSSVGQNSPIRNSKNITFVDGHENNENEEYAVAKIPLEKHNTELTTTDSVVHTVINNKVVPINWYSNPPNLDLDSDKKVSIHYSLKNLRTHFGNVTCGFLKFSPGEKRVQTSLHYSITYKVEKGQAVVSIHLEEKVVNVNCCFHIPLGSTYAISNLNQEEPLILFFNKNTHS